MDAAKKSAVVQADEPASQSGVTHRGNDPVLAAIDAAPWVPVSEDENALLDDIERSTVRWIPHDTFVAALETTRDL